MFVFGLLLDLDWRNPSYPIALMTLVLVFLGCGIPAGFCVHSAFHRGDAVILDPDGLAIRVLGDVKRCFWSEIAAVKVLDGNRETGEPRGVQIEVGMPAGLTSVWMIIPDHYRLGHRALGEAIHAAWKHALVQGVAASSVGSAATEIIASQNRLSAWIAGIAIYVPLALLAFYLLRR